MTLLSTLVNLFFRSRLKEIDRFRHNPLEVQSDQLTRLLKRGAGTEYGLRYGMDGLWDYADFRAGVPVCDYETISPYILRAKDGGKGVLWPGRTPYFAKSSGTTSSKSKYVPVTKAGLKDSHMRGPKDVLAIFGHLYPKSKVLNGKTLTLGGSCVMEREGSAVVGDLSAILIENTPWWASFKRVPSRGTALTADFEKKVAQICKETVGKDVRAFAGVPSWNLVLLNKVLEYTGKDNILEVWPNMGMFVHGGISFKPYSEPYKALIPSDDMKYMETYNASEGFFAISDSQDSDDMLLMLDYGIFYEFLPMQHLGDTSKVVPLSGVEVGINYAMIITTSNGLWRYMIGDTVIFTSLMPYRIKITGRTKHYINVFGEEVMVDNAENAMRMACNATGARVSDYTVAPIFMEGRGKGAHEWVVEFSTAPLSVDVFMNELDRALQSLNSDYEAKRANDSTLYAPTVTVLAHGTFMRWMVGRGKLGGQNKVPRLFNDRTYVDQIKHLEIV